MIFVNYWKNVFDFNNKAGINVIMHLILALINKLDDDYLPDMLKIKSTD